MSSPTALGAKAQSKVLADLGPSGGREEDSAPLSLLPPGANLAGPCLVDTDSCIRLHLHVLPVSQYPGPLLLPLKGDQLLTLKIVTMYKLRVMFHFLGIFRTSSPGGNISSNTERAFRRRPGGEPGHTEVLQLRAGSLKIKR